RARGMLEGVGRPPRAVVAPPGSTDRIHHVVARHRTAEVDPVDVHRMRPEEALLLLQAGRDLAVVDDDYGPGTGIHEGTEQGGRDRARLEDDAQTVLSGYLQVTRVRPA